VFHVKRANIRFIFVFHVKLLDASPAKYYIQRGFMATQPVYLAI